MKTILLISLYELGHQPQGITWPLAFVQHSGLDATAVDLSVEPFDPERIQTARFIGVSVPMHTALRLGFELLLKIRKINPDVHICFYGLYATLNSQFLLSHGANSVIGGEFEEPLVRLADAVISGGNWPSLEGVSSSQKMASPFLYRLSFLTPQRNDLPPLSRYSKLIFNGEEKLAGYAEASRGCKHLCLHCPIPPIYEGRFFAVPKDIVLEDIRKQITMGAQHITFGDPDFLNGPKHALEIARALHAKFPKITFDFTTKIEHILLHEDIFAEFASLGCLFVISALESVSDAVLNNLQKGHTRADIIRAYRILKGVGIYLRPSFVPFTPWITLEDYLDLLNFIEREEMIQQVDPVQLSIRLLVPPGSSLLSKEWMQPHLGKLVEENFYYTWRHPDPRVDELQQMISALVEKAASIHEEPIVTFHRIKAATNALMGLKPPSIPETNCCSQVKQPPRMSESWFCCAEPTALQLTQISNKVILK